MAGAGLRAALTALLALVFLPWMALAATVPPKVVTTIKPLHSLAATIMEGRAEPHLLMSGYVSPHSFSLKPSQGRMVTSADVLFYVHDEMEAFMPKLLRHLEKGRAVELGAMQPVDGEEGLRLLKKRNAQGMAVEKTDWHLWLDVENAMVLARRIAEHLSGIDPEYAGLYQKNLEALLEDLQNLDDALTNRMRPFQDSKFVTLHDAFQYFETAYGLKGRMPIPVTEEGGLGAKSFSELRNRVSSGSVNCIITDPAHPTVQAEALVEGTSGRVKALSAEGSLSPSGAGKYGDFMHSIADGFTLCMGQFGF